jgi:hypothetical protein
LTFKPATDGPGSRRTDEGVVPTWPVLARLPWVGEEEQQIAEVSYEQPFAAVQEHYSAPALRIADEPRGASSRRQYRIDPGVDRKVAAPAPAMRVVASHDEAESFAGHIYRWHAALRPYAGVAVTFVLALFGGLLYWSNFGRHANPTDMTSAPAWHVEANAVPRVAAPTWAGQPALNLPESPLSQTPRIRLDIPQLNAAGEVAPPPAENAHADAEPLIAAPAEDAKPIEEPTPTAGDASQEAVAAAMQEDPTAALSAPVADPSRIDYPTTPFASFDFDPAAAQPATAVDATAPAAR